MRIVTVLASFAVLVTADPVSAQVPTPTLKGDVTVTGEVVKLGDVIANAGGVADMPAFRAPPLGRAGTIQAARVVEAARTAGLSLDPGALGQIVVSRASRRVAKAEIEIAVRKALANRYALDNADVSLVLEGNEAVVHVEQDATEDVSVTDLVFDARSRRVEAVIIVPGSRSLTLKPLRTAGQVVETVDVPMLTRALGRGEALRDGDVRIERRPRAEFQALGFVDVMAIGGRIARNNLQAGAVLRDTDLARQDLVEKNGVVTVVYESPGIALSMRGKALESGALGDVVQVQNTHSKRTLQGTVTAPGVVSVTPGQAGRLAEARTSAVAR
jgi:flagella basal body P-ring formation protein FlgA